MAETNFRTARERYQNRIVELIAKGIAPYVAVKMAKRERRLASPLHKRAVARRIEAATLRLKAVQP